MKILVVISYFVPEIGSAAHAYYDLARSFVELGHEVTVITSYPRIHNLSKDDVDKKFPYYEIIDGIRVYRADNYVDRDNIISRGLEHFLLPGKFLKVYESTEKNFDIALFHIPPLPLYKLAFKLRKRGVPHVLNFQDFHPQELIDVGVLRNPLVIWIMERMERKAYSKADRIVVLTHGGIEYVVSRGADPEKVTHIYNGAPSLKEEFKRPNFKDKESIQNKFLITYAGILSPFQGIDTILDAAKILENDDVIFYIVGDGMMRSHLENRVNDEKIGNVKMLPLQDRESYLDIIKSSDLSIVSLDSRMKAPCFPGKTRSIMSLGVPILALVPESETKRIIESTNSGVVVDPNDKDAIVKAIVMLKERPDMLSSYGENGRRFAQTVLDKKKIANQYIELFTRTINAER